MESRDKKGEDEIYGYTCVVQKKQEIKKKKETYGWKNGNTIKIFLQ